MSKPSVGVIGVGFIGSSIVDAFMHYTDVKGYDIIEDRSTHSYTEILGQDIIFLCLNTPMARNGSVEISLVKDELEKIKNNLNCFKPVVIKSTIPPMQLGELMIEYGPWLQLIYNPEFLTERSARYDYIQSNRFIFGTLVGLENTDEAKKVQELFALRFPAVTQYWCSFAEASMIKYITNCFFSVKVSFFNEVAELLDKIGLDHEATLAKVLLDPRIGRSHFQVPGHDGRKGFGGVCFLKDLAGFIYTAKELEVDPKICKAAWNKNLEVRGDLEVVEELKSLKGRAILDPLSLDEVIDIGNLSWKEEKSGG